MLRQALLVAITSLASLLALASLSNVFAREHHAIVSELADAATLRANLDRALQLLVDGETAQRGYVLTGNPAFLEPLNESREELPSTLEQLREHLRAKQRGAASERLERAIRHRLAFTEETVELARTGQIDAARGRIASGEGRRRTNVVREHVGELVAQQDAELARLRVRADRAREQLFGAFGALVILVLALGAYSVTRVRGELQSIEQAARTLEHAERQARASERRFRALAEGASDLIRIYDTTGRILYASPSSERLLGYTPEELMALAPGMVTPPEDRTRILELMRSALKWSESPEPLVHRMTRKDGQVRWFETRIEPAWDTAGRIERFHSASRDVTARVEEERQRSRDSRHLEQLAHRDELTGLYNRRGFQVHAEELLARARTELLPALLVFCDLDGLKIVNDELGHEAGDGMIRDAAQLLLASARTADVVARLGGDEFVVLGIVRDEGSARAFEARLRERIQSHNGGPAPAYRVAMSFGTSLWRPTDDKPLDVLLQEADAAMYAHKRARRSEADRERKQSRDHRPN